jgi:2-oxoisovalerate dehydrogenase E2 component (dihydrolipoyl transacylase)
MLRPFRLPDVGEGLTEGEILQWLVSVGDTITVNQPLCEVETAKAAVELPSPYAGTVTELLVEVGTTVDVGAPIITIDTDDAVAAGPAAAEPGADSAPAAGLIGGAAPDGRTAVLVGYGPRATEATRRPRRGRATVAAQREDAAPSVGAAPGRRCPRPLAKPPVRKYAKDLGVDLASVTGSGAGGVITRADVASAAATQRTFHAEPPSVHGGREQRIPVKGLRKHTAAAMVASAFTAPHVTEFLTVDVTRMMKLRARIAARPEMAGRQVGPLLFVARALLLAVRRTPMINSSWDEAAQEIVVKNYVNLGIAAATPRGLVVPNIKDADGLSLPELAAALSGLTETARAGRTSPADMSGGTITITNVGVFGVDAGTPILNPGEAAILAFGAVREQPWVHRGGSGGGKAKVRPRQVTQLSLSFDHRIVDGALGSRFLADVGSLLHDPGTALAF